MSRLLRALEKAGLVEIDRTSAPADEETYTNDSILATDDTKAEQAEILGPRLEERIEEQAQAGKNTDLANGVGLIHRGRPLQEVYAEHAVRPSPFPAEKLLKLLDGLRMLDVTSRKAAILALDAADEAWTIDDALLDAEHKLRALRQSQQGLQSQAKALAQQASEQIQQRDNEQQQRSSQIRKQIAELEALLEREITRASEEKSAIQNQLQQHQQQCQQETQRLEEECLRLQELARVFSAEAKPT